MTLREYAKLMNDTALQGSLSNEEYNRLYPQVQDFPLDITFEAFHVLIL